MYIAGNTIHFVLLHCHTRASYTTRATNSTLAQPFSPVLRSVAHIKPIDKSQSSSFSDSSLLIVPSASTHRYDLSSDTPHSHMLVRMNVLPKRASTLRLPEPLVSPISSTPAAVFFILCVRRSEAWGRGSAGWSARDQRVGRGRSSPPRCRSPTFAVARLITPAPCPCILVH